MLEDQVVPSTSSTKQKTNKQMEKIMLHLSVLMKDNGVMTKAQIVERIKYHYRSYANSTMLEKIAAISTDLFEKMVDIELQDAIDHGSNSIKVKRIDTDVYYIEKNLDSQHQYRPFDEVLTPQDVRDIQIAIANMCMANDINNKLIVKRYMSRIEFKFNCKGCNDGGIVIFDNENGLEVIDLKMRTEIGIESWVFDDDDNHMKDNILVHLSPFVYRKIEERMVKYNQEEEAEIPNAE